MTSATDLFGYAPSQSSLFGEGDDRMRPPQARTVPDPADIRLRLHALLEKARAAKAMPWAEREARMWQIVFPQMSEWLPKKEAAQLRFEFETEMKRLAA
jgi:hypothetical protein